MAEDTSRGREWEGISNGDGWMTEVDGTKKEGDDAGSSSVFNFVNLMLSEGIYFERIRTRRNKENEWIIIVENKEVIWDEWFIQTNQKV